MLFSAKIELYTVVLVNTRRAGMTFMAIDYRRPTEPALEEPKTTLKDSKGRASRHWPGQHVHLHAASAPQFGSGSSRLHTSVESSPPTYQGTSTGTHLGPMDNHYGQFFITVNKLHKGASVTDQLHTQGWMAQHYLNPAQYCLLTWAHTISATSVTSYNDVLIWTKGQPHGKHWICDTGNRSF